MRSFAENRIAGHALRTFAVLACMLAAVCGAGAADYPDRVVTLVVPYPPGGGVDAMARVGASQGNCCAFRARSRRANDGWFRSHVEQVQDRIAVQFLQT